MLFANLSSRAFLDAPATPTPEMVDKLAALSLDEPLPPTYRRDNIRLLAQSPRKVYLYWDLAGDPFAVLPEAFTAAQPAPAEAPSDPEARGKYLVTLIGCGRCHTPKNEDGSPKADMFLAGGPFNDKEKVANITPDDETGIGKWTAEQIATFMHTGTRPDGKQIEGTMAQAIDRRFSKLTDEDAAAIAAFLKTIPAVKNDPYAK